MTGTSYRVTLMKVTDRSEVTYDGLATATNRFQYAGEARDRHFPPTGYTVAQLTARDDVPNTTTVLLNHEDTSTWADYVTAAFCLEQLRSRLEKGFSAVPEATRKALITPIIQGLANMQHEGAMDQQTPRNSTLPV